MNKQEQEMLEQGFHKDAIRRKTVLHFFPSERAALGLLAQQRGLSFKVYLEYLALRELKTEPATIQVIAPFKNQPDDAITDEIVNAISQGEDNN